MKRSVFLVVILVCLKLKTINVAYLFNLVILYQVIMFQIFCTFGLYLQNHIANAEVNQIFKQHSVSVCPYSCLIFVCSPAGLIADLRSLFTDFHNDFKQCIRIAYNAANVFFWGATYLNRLFMMEQMLARSTHSKLCKLIRTAVTF